MLIGTFAGFGIMVVGLTGKFLLFPPLHLLLLVLFFLVCPLSPFLVCLLLLMLCGDLLFYTLGMGALGPRLVRSLFGSREEHERRINAQCLAEGHGAHVLMAADFLDLRCMGMLPLPSLGYLCVFLYRWSASCANVCFLKLLCSRMNAGVGFHPSNTDRRVLTTPRLARTFIDGPGPTPWVNPDFNSKPKV